MIEFCKNGEKIVVNIIKKSCLCFIILILIYMISLGITSCIPKSLVKDNIEESVKYFYSSEIDGILYISGFTDAVMLDINYRLDSNIPLKSIMEARMISGEETGIDPVLRI